MGGTKQSLSPIILLLRLTWPLYFGRGTGIVMTLGE
jgi:hypothetical protein